MRGATSPPRIKDLTIEKFQLTHPMRGATCEIQQYIDLVKFQLTHPMRGATNNTAAINLG